MTFNEVLQLAAAATPEAPLPIVVSPCLLGIDVGYDGSSWPAATVIRVCAHPSVAAGKVCPEDSALGTPREAMQVHDGDGHGVLDGTARVVTIGGRDITADFTRGASAMRDLARQTGAVLGILNEISPSCGSHAIHRGEVPERAYRSGVGVTTAMLHRDGVCVISERDHRSLGLLLAALDPTFTPDPEAADFVDQEWYRGYFPSG